MTRYANGHPLSPVERETLRLIACGLTNKEIAAARCVAEGTVAQTIDRISTKLQLGNRTRATLYALRHGIVTLDEACATAGITGEGR